MLNKIINACQKFNECVKHRSNLNDDEIEFLTYFNIELAKSIIKDMDSHNAKQIAKIILAATEDTYSC